MTEQSNFSPLKNAMNFGAMLGLATMIESFIFQLLKVRGGFTSQILMMVVLTVFIVLGCMQYRKSNNGYMSYGQGLGQGVLISFFGSILLGFFTYVFFKYASPESLKEIIDLAQEQLEDQGLSEDQVDMAMQMQSKIMTPGIMGITMILTNTFLGTIISLISSAVLKKENPNPFAE